MSVYRDAAMHTHEAVGQSVAVGRSFLDKCVSLDERMQDVERIAEQLTDVNRALTSLETSFQAASAHGSPERGPPTATAGHLRVHQSVPPR